MVESRTGASSKTFSQGFIKPHGCMCPLHPYQIASYIFSLFYIYVFFIFIDLIALQQYLRNYYFWDSLLFEFDHFNN